MSLDNMSKSLSVEEGNGPSINMSVEEGMHVEETVGGFATLDPVEVLTPQGGELVAQHMESDPASDVLLRPFKVASYTLSNGNTANTTVATDVDLWTLYLANAAVARKTGNYAGIRSSIKVTIVATFPGACYGSYVFSFVPNGGGGQVTYQSGGTFSAIAGTDPYQMCNGDYYVKIDGEKSEDAVVVLPFLWATDYADLPTGPAGSWLMQVFCLTPLATAVPSGATTGNVAVFVQLMDDCKLITPVYQGKVVKSGAGKEFFSKVSKLATLGMMVPNPVVAETSATIASGAAAGAALCDVFGFTKERNPTQSTAVKQKGISSTANVNGDDASTISALFNDNRISINPSINSKTDGQDELAFGNLFDRWTLLSQFAWSQATATGNSLGTINVAPLFCAATRPNMHFTTGGYVGLPFSYWRGDMEYWINISASSLHRGSLQIIYQAVNSAAIAADASNVTNNRIIDVTGSMDVMLKVGFADNAPVLQNEVLYTGLLPAGAFTDTQNGTINFLVMNPLRSQNTASNVTISVFAKCGKNMQFSVPRNGCIHIDGTGTQTTATDFSAFYSYQGIEDEVDQQESYAIVKSSGDYPINDILSGEVIASVRPLLQKPMITNVVFSTTATTPIVPYGGVSNTKAAQRFMYMIHYRILFCCLAASERFKFIPFTSPNTQICSIAPLVYSAALTQQMCPYTGDVLPLTTDGGYEAMVPYYAPQKWVCSYRTISGKMRFAGLNVFTNSGGWATATGTLFQSLGDDIRLSVFRVTPVFIIAATAAATGAAPLA